MYVDGFSVIGWNHPGFGDSTVRRFKMGVATCFFLAILLVAETLAETVFPPLAEQSGVPCPLICI